MMGEIWTSKNNITHDKENSSAIQFLRSIKDALAVLELPMERTKVLTGYGWRPPEGDGIKINTDGSVAMEARRGGAGGVARTRSSFLAAWCKPYPGITDPLIAEALALRDGVVFAHLSGYEKVVFETDNLEIVNLWNLRHSDRAVVAPILSEIREHVPSFKSFVIQHVGRSANVSAHLCAKQASTLDVTDCWLESSPSFLVTSLTTDFAGAVNVE